MTPEALAATIDHTLLKPEATVDDIDKLCDEAVANGFAAVCVNGVFVPRVARRLGHAGAGGPAVCTVAGFPLGSTSTRVKAQEARWAVEEGATEVDMVIHVGAARAGDFSSVRDDILAVAHAVHGTGAGALLKVILETGALTDDQVIRCCRAAAEGEADFVKTSTGMHATGGATVHHVELLHRHASPIRVKASGGIRSLEAAMAMIEAGAARIGTSSGVAIVKELAERGGK